MLRSRPEIVADEPRHKSFDDVTFFVFNCTEMPGLKEAKRELPPPRKKSWKCRKAYGGNALPAKKQFPQLT